MPLFKPEVNYALTPTPLTPEEEMEISKFDDDSPTFKLFKKYEQEIKITLYSFLSFFNLLLY